MSKENLHFWWSKYKNKLFSFFFFFCFLKEIVRKTWSISSSQTLQKCQVAGIKFEKLQIKINKFKINGCCYFITYKHFIHLSANLTSYHTVKVFWRSFNSSRIGQPLSSWLKQKEKHKKLIWIKKGTAWFSGTRRFSCWRRNISSSLASLDGEVQVDCQLHANN